ncbi:MAG: flagellar export chaperone FlgN [Candidatus Melainabacteria bacterium]|nr:flagellar export chaperone FlgN [Candidatus Melainabacteria bacterium]
MNPPYASTNYLTPQAIEPLKQTLLAEVDCLNTIRQCMSRRKEHIVNGQTEALMAEDKHLLALQKQLSNLENQRERLLPEEAKTLQELIEKMPAKEQVPFRQLRQQLQRLAEDIQNLGKESRLLLEHSLAWLHDTFNLIVGHVAPEPAAYNQYGNKANLPASHTALEPLQSTRETRG